ncbi:type VI secretion system protein TssA [Ralstonia sp. CHL-2022]|uniref:Type VI secretion system protein TssA n=1 Tax=Ralstonia mojiangensis TaxID=2953895 RepID=A0ABT2LFA5_9RALS|nr:type VI secretion system protein TssA [Ralstonia mojiangensis]MCT7299169.1 type VI secretion system protein TssA [Ralstonia mojiangensis]MCT7314101.1 type VI secretion system protein TssA [Ralstonia mojiangensis]
MASLPFDQLLAPLPGAQPCGEDMLFSAEFDSIQDARRFDDPSLDQGEWVTEIKEADWRAVIAQSTSLLQNRTKDLRLAAWLAEALSKERGFAGLREGYELIAGLCEQFWEHLYPLPEADDPEARMGSMAWLATRSSQLIREVPLVEAGKGGYSLIDWEVATSLVEAIRRDPEQADELSRGKITQEQFESARRATPPAFYKTLHDDVVGCGAALLRLESVLDARAGDHAPSFRPAREALQAVRALVERFGGKPEPKPTAVEAKGAQQQAAQSGAGAVVETVAVGPIRTRAQALNQLRDVAEFFRQTEPHSPVAYLAARAAKWGDMPLHAWLRTVVKDDATLSQIEELLGLGDPPSESAS